LVADVAYEKIMEVALAPYATRKNALRGLGGSAALELNGHGIRVNTVHSGAVEA